MVKVISPYRGQWYKRIDLDTLFEVVAIDEEDKTIEIQYFNGEIEELDESSWNELTITAAAAPEDWSGALEVDTYSLSEDTINSPTSLDEALGILDSSEY